MTIKLFKFSLRDIDEVLYIYSVCSNEQFLRHQFEHQDHGSIHPDTYYELYTYGEITRITSIDQISKEDLEWIPFTSEEFNHMGFGMFPKDFFNPSEDYL